MAEESNIVVVDGLRFDPTKDNGPFNIVVRQVVHMRTASVRRFDPTLVEGQRKAAGIILQALRDRYTQEKIKLGM